MDPQDRCIAADSLLTGHALSFADQPYFKSLIETARNPKRPLVVIAGAGISMAAGLPSWYALIANLERRLVPEDIAPAFSALNKDDLERRTDTVLFLTGDSQITSGNVKHLKEALYGDSNEPEPSSVAQAIALLASVYRARISILTTNFDEVLETAMSEVFGDVSVHSFETWNAWCQLDDAEHRASIMHLHGLVYSDDRGSLLPLVLSESDFRTNGPAIQEELCEILQTSDVLVVGASLADRNIATPLAMTKKSPTQRFVLATPTLVSDQVPPEDCANVAVWQANAMQHTLAIKPVLLKSYAQVSQVVNDCALAADSPGKYRPPSSSVRVSDSLHYGTRFRVALQSAYEILGASPRTGAMQNDEALTLSRRVHQLTFQRNGPHHRLSQLRRRYKGKCADEENIGIFVWLRDLPTRPGSEFALRLMVTSAYAHWSAWSAFRLEPIVHTSTNAAVQAAFTGRPVFLDVPRARHSGAWQGAWAQPLLAGFSASDSEVAGWPLDQLQLGAVAVNTDCKVTSDSAGDAKELSALAVLTQEELAWFREAIDGVVEELFAGP